MGQEGPRLIPADHLTQTDVSSNSRPQSDFSVTFSRSQQVWEEGAGPPEAFSLWRRREWLAPRLATDQFVKLSSFFQGNPGNDGLPGNPGLPGYIVSNRESRRRWRLRSSTSCLFCLVSFVFTDQCYKGTKLSHLQQCFIKNLIKKKRHSP